MPYNNKFKYTKAFTRRAGRANIFPTKGQLQAVAARAIQAEFRKKRLRSQALKGYQGNLYLKGGSKKPNGMYHRYK